MASTKSEVEVKIAVVNPSAAKRSLRKLGFQVHVPRVFEANTIYDYTDLRLRGQGKVLRLRQAGKVSTLTFKGKGKDTHHKVREEVETTLAHYDAMDRVFRELELSPVFRYEKYRTEFAPEKGRGVVTLDETPIGTFIEIEGAPEWIDRTATQLGFSPTDYITASYGALYLQYCSEHGVEPSNMVFRAKR